MYFLYVLRNTTTEKVYIGQSISPSQRIKAHKHLLTKGAHKNVHLQSSWNIYGPSCFESYVLGEYSSREDVNDAEIFYIHWYKLLGLSYNMLAGGEVPPSQKGKIGPNKGKVMPFRGVKRDEEFCKKVSDGQKRSFENGRVSPNKGVPMSEEQKEKLRIANTGKSRPDIKGIKRPPEFGQKVSNSRKGMIFSDEHKENLKKAWERRRQHVDGHRAGRPPRK